MREIIIVFPGTGCISRDLEARIAKAIEQETGCSRENMVIHQWDNEDNPIIYIPEDGNVDATLQKSIAIVSEVYESVEDKQMFLPKVMTILYLGNDEASLLRNAIVTITEYSKPARLFTAKFGLKKPIYNDLKALQRSHLL